MIKNLVLTAILATTCSLHASPTFFPPNRLTQEEQRTLTEMEFALKANDPEIARNLDHFMETTLPEKSCNFTLQFMELLVKLSPQVNTIYLYPKEESDNTDCILQYLPKFKKVKNIELNTGFKITPEVISTFRKLPYVPEISLFSINDKENTNNLKLLLAYIDNPHLRLSYENPIPKEILQALINHNKPFSLSLYYCNMDENHLRAIGSMAHLRSLEIEDLTYSDYDNRVKYPLAFFSNLKNLESLYIDEGSFFSNDLSALDNLTSLKSLTLKNCLYSEDEEIIPPKNLPSLEKLDLYPCTGRITNNTLERIATYSNLVELKLGYIDQPAEYDGACLNSCLEQNTHLKKLILTLNDSAQDEDLAFLTKLPSLEKLALYKCRNLTDKGIELISSLPSLKRLGIGFAHSISRYSLESLSKAKNLRELAFFNIDTLTLEDLKELDASPTLETIGVKECPRINGYDSFYPLILKKVDNAQQEDDDEL